MLDMVVLLEQYGPLGWPCQDGGAGGGTSVVLAPLLGEVGKLLGELDKAPLVGLLGRWLLLGEQLELLSGEQLVEIELHGECGAPVLGWWWPLCGLLVELAAPIQDERWPWDWVAGVPVDVVAPQWKESHPH